MYILNALKYWVVELAGDALVFGFLYLFSDYKGVPPWEHMLLAFLLLGYLRGVNNTVRSRTKMSEYKGWECPKCGGVYHPDVKECPKCSKRVWPPLETK